MNISICFCFLFRMPLSNPLDTISKAGGSITKSLSGTMPLSSLQKSLPMHGASDTLPSAVTLSFLESQIAASYLLQSSNEYKHWLLCTVNHLLEKGKQTISKQNFNHLQFNNL